MIARENNRILTGCSQEAHGNEIPVNNSSFSVNSGAETCSAAYGCVTANRAEDVLPRPNMPPAVHECAVNNHHGVGTGGKEGGGMWLIHRTCSAAGAGQAPEKINMPVPFVSFL